MKQLDFIWRSIATVLSFVLFGVLGLVLGVVVVPLVRLLVFPRQRRVRLLRRALAATVRCFVGFMKRCKLIALDVRNAPLEGVYVITANHPTLIDALLLLSIFPTAECVVKSPLLNNPFTRFVLDGADYIGNADAAAMLEEGEQRLRSGQSMLLFPEGTRTTPGKPVSLMLGAATLCLRAQVDCLPVVIQRSPATLSKDHAWYHVPPSKVTFKIQIGEPIAVADYAHIPLRKAKRQMTADLETMYRTALLEEPVPLQSVSRAEYEPAGALKRAS